MEKMAIYTDNKPIGSPGDLTFCMLSKRAAGFMFRDELADVSKENR